MEYNLVTGMIGFDPVRWENDRFRCFWSLGSGWGTFTCDRASAHIEVLSGSLTLNEVRLPFLRGQTATCRQEGSTIAGSWGQGSLTFSQPVTISAREALTIG